jgi:hypothetical protein
MTTRYDKKKDIPNVLPSGYEGSNTAPESTVPSCGIEDVDRAFFSLFNENLPMVYRLGKESGDLRRIPVVFASGERFALASKKEPLRDKNNTLILPLISIARSGVEQESTKGMALSDRYNEMVIKREISKEDSIYQNLANPHGFKNVPKPGKGSDYSRTRSYEESTGRYLDPNLGKGLYETIVIPMPKYFTVKYEVTFWAQYNQQLNDMMTCLMGAYVQPGNRTVRIESNKGYWFVAYFDAAFSNGSNFDSFTDDERLVKSSITVEVPAYMILPSFPNSPNGVRKFVSAPVISFGYSSDESSSPQETLLKSGKVDPYLLSSVSTEDSPVPGMSIGESGKTQTESMAGAYRQGATTSTLSVNDSAVGNVGSNLKKRKTTQTYDIDPVTGEKREVRVYVSTVISSKGEQVFTLQDLGKIS